MYQPFCKKNIMFRTTASAALIFFNESLGCLRLTEIQSYCNKQKNRAKDQKIILQNCVYSVVYRTLIKAGAKKLPTLIYFSFFLIAVLCRFLLTSKIKNIIILIVKQI